MCNQYTEKGKDGKVERQKTLDEVQKQVAEDLLRERQQKAYQELMERMMRSGQVVIYDDLVK